MKSVPNSVSVPSLLSASLLSVSLALSACQDPSPPADSTNSETTDMTNDSTSVPTSEQTDSNNPAIADTEQLMIDKLARYRWTLASATKSDSQPISSLMAIEDQVTLTFNEYHGENAISYSVGCNVINATVQLQANTLTVEDSMSTKMLCDDLNNAENQLNGVMQGDSQLSLTEDELPTLTQMTSDSSRLVWSGNLTSRAKYNSKGETIFWAVDAKSKPCSDNKAQMCLQIKPVTYDEQGIKSTEGEFVEFAGTIDGYQHNENNDEVLRLQRFKTDVDTVLVDNIDSKYAYVLDTVIESSVSK